MTRRLLGLALALAAADGSRATNLDAPADLKPINVEITTASYRGQPATRVRRRVQVLLHSPHERPGRGPDPSQPLDPTRT